MDLNTWPNRHTPLRLHLESTGQAVGLRSVMATLCIEEREDEDGETYIDTMMSVLGPRNAGDFFTLGSFLGFYGKNIAEDSGDMGACVSDAEFKSIANAMENPENSSGGAHGDGQIEVGWGSMSDLDRALALDYVLRLEGSPDSEPEDRPAGVDLTYVDHPVLRELEADLTHLHAVILDRRYRLRDLLRDDEIEHYEKVLAEYDAGEGDPEHTES